MADTSANSAASQGSPSPALNTSVSSSSSASRTVSSRTLLDIKGDGSREAIVEHLLEVNQMIAPKKKPQMCKIERSPLFAQLESFLPSLDASNKRLDALPESERHNLCMEASDDDSGSRYIELSILESEQMQDSKVFQLLNLTGSTPSTTVMGDESSSDSSDDSDDDSGIKNSGANKLSLVKSISDDGVDNGVKNKGAKKVPLVRSASDDEDDESRDLDCDR